ncbi:MAG: response regulator transcription factor [Prolixibacteraceae bacterium]|nr:response regulator transcription factor [Prolixibacteraceae bacterium]
MSLILVDDHQMFREGLHLLLSKLNEIDKIREASNAAELFELLKQEVPQLIFMDIDLPGTDGIEITREVLKSHPSINIIALSMYADEVYYLPMIEAGAKGFILKNSGFDDVENSIKRVMAGKYYYSQEILSGLISARNRKKHQQKKNNDLSERETEILQSICLGLSNIEIAEKLNISKRTVDKHRENILQKTKTKNTAGLVMFAIKNGIIPMQ